MLAKEDIPQLMLSHINVGTGEDVTIRELAETVQCMVGFNGRIDGILENPMEHHAN